MRDEGLKEIIKLEKLKELSFLWNTISDKGAEAISNLSNLRSLSVGAPNLTDKGVAHLCKLSKLDHLYLKDLSAPNVTDGGAKEIAKLANLKVLVLLGHCSFSNEGAKVISGLKNLEYLNLKSDGLTDKCAGYLTALDKLTTLYLRSKNITIEGEENVKKALPNCDVHINLR